PGWSFAVAGRRSYVDAVLGAAMSGSSDQSFTTAPRYYDAQARIDWKPQGSAHEFSFLALTSNDKLGMLFKRPSATTQTRPAASHFSVSGRMPTSNLHLEGEPSMGRPDQAPTEISQMRYHRYTPALWADARWKPLAGVTLTPGVRVDEYDYVTDRARSSITIS